MGVGRHLLLGARTTRRERSHTPRALLELVSVSPPSLRPQPSLREAGLRELATPPGGCQVSSSTLGTFKFHRGTFSSCPCRLALGARRAASCRPPKPPLAAGKSALESGASGLCHGRPAAPLPAGHHARGTPGPSLYVDGTASSSRRTFSFQCWGLNQGRLATEPHPQPVFNFLF